MGSALRLCLLRETCGWILAQNTRKYLFFMHLRQWNFVQYLGASSTRGLRSRPAFTHQRLSAIPLGQRRSMPRSLFKQTSPKARPYSGGDASTRTGPLWPSLRPRCATDPARIHPQKPPKSLNHQIAGWGGRLRRPGDEGRRGPQSRTGTPLPAARATREAAVSALKRSFAGRRLSDRVTTAASTGGGGRPGGRCRGSRRPRRPGRAGTGRGWPGGGRPGRGARRRPRGCGGFESRPGSGATGPRPTEMTRPRGGAILVGHALSWPVIRHATAAVRAIAASGALRVCRPGRALCSCAGGTLGRQKPLARLRSVKGEVYRGASQKRLSPKASPFREGTPRFRRPAAKRLSGWPALRILPESGARDGRKGFRSGQIASRVHPPGLRH